MKENQAPLTMANQDDQGVVTREDILKLIKAREEIDEKIVALGGILESNRVGMTEPLVDQEGYPRNDIDVYQVRHARHKIICFQNDFKALTKRIDSSLAKYHQRLKEQGTNGTPMEVDNAAPDVVLSPIAKVNLVSEGSPAFHAGLKVDDVVLSFGSLDSTNFTELSQIGTLVQRSVGSMVSVKVKRNLQTVKLALIPGPWSGRGLLGCNIIPYDAIDR